jgi:hypothetical protein
VSHFPRRVIGGAPRFTSDRALTWAGAVCAVEIPDFSLVGKSPFDWTAAHIALGWYLHTECDSFGPPGLASLSNVRRVRAAFSGRCEPEFGGLAQHLARYAAPFPSKREEVSHG